MVEGDRLVAIREHADATPAERAITLCNAGVMAFDGRRALEIIEKIGHANAKGEYYLTDAVTVVRELGLEAVVIETSEDEVRGINTKAQLAEAEQVMQARLRKAALEAGVTMIAPETVYLAADTTFGNDVTIEPFVVIGPGVSIADGAVIHAFSHIVQASIGKKASVGPYARLRPGHFARRGRAGSAISSKPKPRPWRPAPRPTISPTSAMPMSAPMPISAPAPSPAIMTASTSTAPRSARARSSARIRRWWRR